MSRLGAGRNKGPDLSIKEAKEGQVSKEISSLQKTLVDLDGKVGVLTNKLADVMISQPVMGVNPSDNKEEETDIVNIATQIRQLRYHAVNIINQLTDITQRIEL